MSRISKQTCTIAICHILLAALLSGCPEKTPSSSEAVSQSLARKPGGFFFKFDYKTVTRVSIAKNDPNSGDRFSTQIERSPTGSELSAWKIVSQELTDRLAYSNFIEHLLDTLSTLQIEDIAPQGPLESYGLNPPRFAIRFSAENRDKPGSQTEFEIHFGSGEENVFAYDPQEPKRVFRVRGAGVSMLGHLRGFEALRRRTLLTFEGDDVDEIEFWNGAKKTLHIERHGDLWKEMNPKVRKLDPNTDVQAYLEKITHFQIQRFPDDPAWEKTAFEALQKKPLLRIVFKDRKNAATELRIRPHLESKVLTASLSSREGAVFIVPQELSREFSKILIGP
ncbi:DUF4340 domain-containing protein [Bdellovibrionota bacterium FG-2]